MRISSATQLKDLIKNMVKENNSTSQILLRTYMLERFLERLSLSQYKDAFIIKGGMLVSAIVGIKARSTMDLDATIKGITLDEDNLVNVIMQICDVHLDDNTRFEFKSIEEIMDTADYPGLRVSLNAFIETTRIPIKLDISTGDIITPKEIKFQYPLLIEKRNIELWAYNIETVLAEKVESVIARITTNTRMRDFYDIYILTEFYDESINYKILKLALLATATKRGTVIPIENIESLFATLRNDIIMQRLWNNYQKSYSYAKDIRWEEAVNAVEEICGKMF